MEEWWTEHEGDMWAGGLWAGGQGHLISSQNVAGFDT